MTLSVDIAGFDTFRGISSCNFLDTATTDCPVDMSFAHRGTLRLSWLFLAFSHSNSFVVRKPARGSLLRTNLSKMNDSAYWLLLSCAYAPAPALFVASLWSATALPRRVTSLCCIESGCSGWLGECRTPEIFIGMVI